MAKDYMQWFLEARLGMFIHWGVYAIPTRGEWIRNHESLGENVYQPFVETSNIVQHPVHPVNPVKNYSW